MVRMTEPLRAEVVALTLFRCLPNGEGRNYTATTFPADPWRGCSRFVRMCQAVGWVRESTAGDDCYGVLDALDQDGSIVQDWSVPTAAAFRGIKKKLSLCVEGA